jgi:hypothetical protein
MLNETQRQMFDTAACMGVLVFLAFFGAYAGQTFSQPPIPRPIEETGPQKANTTSSENNTYSDHRGTDQSPLIVTIHKTAEEERDARETRYEREKQSANDRTFSAVSAFLGFLTLIVIAVQAYFLWRAVRGADTSANISRQALVEVQRAFVFLRTFEFNFINRDVHILPLRENSGSTPANNRTNWASWKSFVEEPPPGFYLADLDANGQESDKSRTFTTTFLGPHATQFADVLTIPLDTVKAVNDRDARLFIWGWTEYRDVFEGTPIHRTEFCNEVVVADFVRDDAADRTKAYLRLIIYGPYNTAK